MPQECLTPEGRLWEQEPGLHDPSPARLEEARIRETPLEAIATKCDEERTLHLRLGEERGFIPREECALGADTGQVREIAILSRVGKPVRFVPVKRTEQGWLCSRRRVQEDALLTIKARLEPGDVIPFRVTHLERFGAFVDIGAGIVSMVGLETISVSRIQSAAQRFVPGQDGFAVVTGVDRVRGRVFLSHRELLGTWEENAACFSPGTAVPGVIRGVEPYGVFVELAPNLSGLAEPMAGVWPGMRASVYIKSILPQRMKIKLNLLDARAGDGTRLIRPEDYRITAGRLRRWRYGPEDCPRAGGESEFSPHKIFDVAGTPLD